MTDTALMDVSPDHADLAMIVADWLTSFERAAGRGDVDALGQLFVEDCWWRDLLCVTWDLSTARGIAQIRDKYGDRLADVGFRAMAPAAEPPAVLADGKLTAFVEFATAQARGRGVLRLVLDEGRWRAWTFLTAMEELVGHEELRTSIHDASRGAYNQAVDQRETWPEMRQRQREFADAEPAVVVVGAGHAGLNIAARLGHLGVPTLVLEQTPRVGDVWRNRYNNLLLHDPKWYGQMPYLPYPDNWPVFAPKEMVADWLEAYSWILQLNVWTGTRVESAVFDDAAGQWTVGVVRDGVRRELRPNHVVFATGAFSGTPRIPQIPGLEDFRGRALHSGVYDGGGDLAGRKIVVVGTGASGHDVAQDAYEMGAEVTMVQRSPTYVISSQYGVPATHEALYSENSPPVDQADLLSLSFPWKLYLELQPPHTQRIAEIDKELLDGLRAAGFQLTDGINGSGLLGLGIGRGGGFYIDKGCSSLIADRKIALKHGEITRFTPDGVVYSDGTEAPADLVVFATGWPNMRDTLRPVVGDDVADGLTTVWGFDEQGEINGLFRPSGHPRLWFMAGGFQQSRYGSKFLALQIKAIETGLHRTN
jgi:cation diffusion facilitator CzcD-associated flavoprotein CzcO